MGGSKIKQNQVKNEVKPTEAPKVPITPVSNKPLKSTAPIAQLLDEYVRDYNRAEIRPEWLGRAQAAASRIMKNMGIYTIVADKVTRIPPYVIGLIHMMEASFDFTAHLHNGDPLTARTVQVPKGRPLKGNPPFTWTESAIDALLTDRVGSVPAWTLGYTLRFMESFNGFGTRNYHGMLTPYLYSGTNLYTKGKYIADGKWSDSAVSKQLGVVTVMKCLPKGLVPSE